MARSEEDLNDAGPTTATVATELSVEEGKALVSLKQRVAAVALVIAAAAALASCRFGDFTRHGEYPGGNHAGNSR